MTIKTIQTFGANGGAIYAQVADADQQPVQTVFKAGTMITSDINGNTTLPGNLIAGTVGAGLEVKEGSNAKQGTATLVGGTVVVSNNSVTANSRIFLSGQNSSGTAGALTVSARTAGTSFTILSTSNTDTRLVAYEIFEPAA